MGDLQDDGTVEYGVACRDGEPHNARSYDSRRFADDALLAFRDRPKMYRAEWCGPHVVVRRSVGPWVPVGDNE